MADLDHDLDHRSMNTRRIGGGFLALLLLSGPLIAQIGIAGDAIQMLASKPGRTVKGKITVVNTGTIPASFRIFPLPSKSKRDASSWITFEEEYLNIPAGSALRIGYRVKVPKKVTGSFFTRYCVQPTAREKVGMIGIRIRYEGTVVITVPNGIEKVEFVSCEYRNGNLFSTLKNTGTIAYRPSISFFAGGREYRADRRLLLPGREILFAVTALNLPAGKCVVFCDYGPNAIGTQWTIEGTEAIREFTTIVPVRARIQSDFGPGGNRLLASLSSTIGRWHVGAGSFFDHDRSRVNLNLGYTARAFSLYGYWYKRSDVDRWALNLSGSLHVKRWHVILNTQPFAESGQMMLRYRFNRGYLGLRSSLIHGNLDWNFSVSLPFDLNIKIRRKIKGGSRRLKTFSMEVK